MAHRAMTVLFCALLTACGGGGGSSAGPVGNPDTSATPTPSSAASNTSAPVIANPPLPNTGGVPGSSSTLGIIADNAYTTAGGSSIRFQVSGTASGDAAQWELSPGDPGSLVNTTGAVVTYNPPPANSISGDTTISITVKVGEALATARLLLVAKTPAADMSPPNPPPTVFAVVAQSERTVAGGAPVTLSASKPSSSGTVTWNLEPGSPGRLDRTSGDSVQYIPPVAGSVVSNINVTVNASLGNEARKTTIVLEGTQGLSLVAGNDGGIGNRDGSGTAARFYNPRDAAADAQGNLYIADTYNRTIRKISPDGTVTTFAGSPYDPRSGSVDGTGTSARFSDPRGIAVDAAGNIYVADAKAIRKITPESNVTTLAGKVDASGSVDGIGDQARFNGPYRIAVDAGGNLFVTDVGTIRKITPSGSVTTVLTSTDGESNPFQMLNTVRGIAVDKSGNLYVVDAYDQNSRRDVSYASSSIRKITPDGVVTTLAGVHGTRPRTQGPIGSSDGTGTDARFNYPDGITIDAAGNLFVSDTGNRTIRKITPAGAVTTIAGTAGLSGSADGNGTAARFLTPQGITIDPEGNLYVADSINHTIRKVASNGDVVTVAGKPTNYGSRDGVGASALFWDPAGIAADRQGNMYIADRTNHTIRKISRTGEVSTIAGMAGQPGSANGAASAAQFSRPNDVAVDAAGNLYVADGNDLIRKITPAGVVSTLTEYRAGAITVDADGNVYAARFDSPNVRKVTPSGATTDISMLIAPESAISIMDITLDPAGNLFAATSRGIRKITPTGILSPVGPQTPSPPCPIIHPLASISIDEDGNLYTNVCGGGLRKTTQAGEVSQVFDLEPLGFAQGFLGERKHFEMVGPKTMAITVPNGVYLLRLP
jgi:sugar lactone lactonase YvrE